MTMYRAGWRVLYKKKAVRNLAVIDTDQVASGHPIDPDAIPKRGAAALPLLNAQRANVALTAAARNTAATEKAAVANAANETANRDQHASLAKAADASVAPVTTDALQALGKKDARIGGAVVAAEEAAKGMKHARGVAIPRIKPMEIPRGGVRRALLFQHQHLRVWRG